MDRERFEELVEAYVLGALTEEERLEFERDLAAHPEHQAEVDELGAVAALLALYPEEQDPPRDLRRRVMSAVEAEAPRSGRGGLPGRLGELFGSRGLLAALGAAVALIFAGLLSWNLVLTNDVEQLQARVGEMRASQDVRRIALEGPVQERGARALLIVTHPNRAVLVVEKMPPVPEGKMCQIWVNDDDHQRPGGLFEPKQEAVATVVKAPIKGADSVAITVEPEGGSRRPTSHPLLSADL